MKDRIMEQIIVEKTAAPTFSVHQAERTEILTFKGHNKDQGVVQISVVHQEAQIHRNRMVERRGIQMFVNPPAINPVSNDLPADHPAVQIHDVQEAQIRVIEEDVDLPLISNNTQLTPSLA